MRRFCRFSKTSLLTDLKAVISYTRSLIAGSLTAGSLLSGCNLINPAEPLPTYVRVDGFSYASTAGDDTAQIESVFASFDGRTVGTFDLPALIPVLAGGGGALELRPGVSAKGLKSYQLAYPHYRPDTVQIAPQPGGEITRAFSTEYYLGVEKKFSADFDLGELGFVRFGGQADLAVTPFNMAAEPALAGDYSGLIQLSAAEGRTLSENVSARTFLPGTNNYLEFEYRCTIPFFVGIRSETTETLLNLVGLNPTSKRTKIYVPLDAEFAGLPSTSGYRIILSTELPAGTAEGLVVIDNIRVVSN